MKLYCSPALQLYNMGDSVQRQPRFQGLSTSDSCNPVQGVFLPCPVLLGFSRTADLAILSHYICFQFWIFGYFLGFFSWLGFFFIEGHNTGIYINAFKNTCPVKLQSNNSLKTKICFWQLKFSRFGQGGLLHWEQYILKKKLLKDVASPFIPSLWKLLNSKAKHFLSKLLKL